MIVSPEMDGGAEKAQAMFAGRCSRGGGAPRGNYVLSGCSHGVAWEGGMAMSSWHWGPAVGGHLSGEGEAGHTLFP